MRQNLKDKAYTIASILSTVTADAVLIYDYVTLERYVNELIKNNNFVSINVLKSDGTIIANAKSSQETKHVYNLLYPVMIDNDKLGEIHLSISMDKVDLFLKNMIIGSIIFVIIIHLSGLFINNRLIDRLVFRPLKKLTEATEEIKKGNYDIVVKTDTKDEFSNLADAMNSMIKTIKYTFDEIVLNKNKLEAIIDNIADGIFVTDAEEIILEFNKSAESFTGYSREDVIGKHCEDIFKTNLCEEACAIRNQNKVIYNKESTFITKDGSERIALVSSKLISDSNGKPLVGVQTFKDITEDKERQASFFHTEKMVAIGEMASAIAHEVNNPLSNIIGYSKILINSKNVSINELLDKLKIINDQASKAASIVQDLLNFSRRGAGKDQIVDVATLVRNIVKITSIYTYNKDIDIDISFIDNEGNGFLVRLDSTKIEQLIFNLLINSIQAIDSEGVIRIELTKQGNDIIIKVIDNGKGIEDNNLKKIFQPFFTTKPIGKGTGLGLFIVKTILKEIGGDIEVESKVNEGTSFTITLPVNL